MPLDQPSQDTKVNERTLTQRWLALIHGFCTVASGVSHDNPSDGKRLVDLLVRYSNHEDALGRVVKVLGRIEQGHEDDEPGVRLPKPPPLRGIARLSLDDVRQIVAGFRAGTPKHALAHRYGISLSTVKRLLRTEGIGRATP